MAQSVFAFEQPVFRKLRRPHMSGWLLVFGAATWLVLYAGLGWRFWMRGIHLLAESISNSRKALPEDYPLMLLENRLFDEIGKVIERMRIERDASFEQLFSSLYGGLDARELRGLEQIS